MINRPHPLLYPLNSDEITRACQLVKNAQSLQDYHRFIYVTAEEPQPELMWDAKAPELDRIAFVCVLDSKHNLTYEGRVNLTTQQILRWETLPLDQAPYGQAPILPEEALKSEAVVKKDPAWRAAMKRRNLTDAQIDLIQVDSFSAGYFGIEAEKGKRLVRTTCYYRDKITDNGYARPIEGVIAVVDLTAGTIIDLFDDGKNTPIPTMVINYDRESITQTYPTTKSINITQPEGPGFTVKDGWFVEWENWKFQVGFTQREGLVLHTVSYYDEDQDRDRPILHRASLTDMFVPYADPTPSQFFKAAFDSGDNGFGCSANSLKLGCDCLGHIHYFDVAKVTPDGTATTIEHAVCMHEEDANIAATHSEQRTGVRESWRQRELVISSSYTIDNYDYVKYIRLNRTGEISYEILLTGIVQTRALYPGEKYEFGALLTHELGAPYHQHLFNVRLHMCVDGFNNAVKEIEVGKIPKGPRNPYGNSFAKMETVLKTESEGARFANAATQREWVIFNPSVINAGNGSTTSYQLHLPQTPLLAADEDSYFYKRGGFATRSLWVSPFDSAQKYASGDYPNQHAGGNGFPAYLQKNRNIYDTSVVIWPVFGATHFTAPENFPVMPTVKVGFMLTPSSFFKRNTVMGLKAESNKTSVKHNENTSIHEDEIKDCCSGLKK